MPTISITTSVAANSRSGNVLAGQLFEFLRRRSIVGLAVSAAAAGLVADWSIGGEQLLTAAVPPATNRFPIVPDDAMNKHGGLGGERLFLEYTNSTGAPLVVQTVVDISPF